VTQKTSIRIANYKTNNKIPTPIMMMENKHKITRMEMKLMLLVLESLLLHRIIMLKMRTKITSKKLIQKRKSLKKIIRLIKNKMMQNNNCLHPRTIQNKQTIVIIMK
jgi:hypothetical protein